MIINKPYKPKPLTNAKAGQLLRWANGHIFRCLVMYPHGRQEMIKRLRLAKDRIDEVLEHLEGQ